MTQYWKTFRYDKLFAILLIVAGLIVLMVTIL